MRSSSSNTISSSNYIPTTAAVNRQLVEAVLSQPKVTAEEEWNIATVCALFEWSKVLRELDVFSKCGTYY